MSFRPELYRYLAHFGRSTTIGELHDQPEADALIGLRHDVDHSLDLALELAWIENERGLRASYYLLTSHPYVTSDLFLEKCLQIQELGHEIGVHNDAITLWVQDATPPEVTLRNFLARLHKAGILIRGTSTHGARSCYTHGYLNSWCFRESREDTDGHWNAEGLPTEDPEETIKPPGAAHVEHEGRRLKLWALSMQDLGLEYEAHRVPVDTYYTDSGGSWRRSPDPLTADLQRGRYQVLIHPEWWGQRKRIFVLSSARSGSKWFANLIDQSTSAVAKHEFTLNHRYSGGMLQVDKRTGEGFKDFITQQSTVRSRLRESAAWTKSVHEDYVEANVYLTHFADELRETFPDATFVHLHRDGRDVVRSLLNRSWYDTPDDDRHPALDIEDWEFLSQIEKCCWYWAQVNESLLTRTNRRLSLERASSDKDHLLAFLDGLGIRVTLPDIFSSEHARMVNENYATDVPPFSEWAEYDQQTFARICGEVQKHLGHPVPPTTWPEGSTPNRRRSIHAVTLVDHSFDQNAAEHIDAYRATRCDPDPTPEGLRLSVPPDRGGHATIHLGKGRWAKPDKKPLTTRLTEKRPFNDSSSGPPFAADRFDYCRLEMEAELTDGLRGSAMILLYDEEGNPVRSPHRRTLASGNNTVRLSFRPTPSTHSFTFGLFFPEVSSGECIIRTIRLLGLGESKVPEGLTDTDRFYRDEGFGYSEEMVTKWLRANVELPERGRVLDLCCGDGIWSKGIHDLRPDLELFGVDISEGGIEQARHLLGTDYNHFLVADAEGELPFPKGFFQLIFARGPGLYNQHDMDRPATIAVIERWHELLSPGGTFYSVYGSAPEKMGTYTPPDEVKLPYNRYPRLTDAVDFRGGKYHHTRETFLLPFEKAANVTVHEYRFERNLHVLVTSRM